MLFCGVAAACALGVGAGLWARPALHERQAAAVAAPEPVEAPPATTRKLQIVVDDRPLPTGAPIQVLPAVAARPEHRPLFDLPAMLAPKRAPEGLIRAQAVLSPAAPAPTPPPQAAETPRPRTLRVLAPALTGAVAAARHAN
ncbi:MAG TPA: hypothetical protein VGC92_04605, partial [Phenylobacterium sp.]